MERGATALVTGATAGIGRAIAFALGRAGYRVGVCARDGAAVARLLADLEAEGIDAAGQAADVGRAADVSALVELVTDPLGPVDVLVNNAGIGIFKPFDALTLDEWDTTMTTNVRSMFLMSKAVLPSMRARRSGTIINIASQAGRTGFVGGTAYAASKHAVLGFSRSLLLETRHHDIRVLAICPGSVDTSLMRNQSMLERDPSRILQPEDIAHTVVHALRLPARAMISELDIRPTNP